MEFGLVEGNADGDGVPRRGVGVHMGDFAGERNVALEKPAEVAIAEARHVTQLGAVVKDFHGKRVVRIVRLGTQVQSGAGAEGGQYRGTVVVLEAGDGEGEDVVLARRWRIADGRSLGNSGNRSVGREGRRRTPHPSPLPSAEREESSGDEGEGISVARSREMRDGRSGCHAAIAASWRKREHH